MQYDCNWPSISAPETKFVSKNVGQISYTPKGMTRPLRGDQEVTLCYFLPNLKAKERQITGVTDSIVPSVTPSVTAEAKNVRSNGRGGGICPEKSQLDKI